MSAYKDKLLELVNKIFAQKWKIGFGGGTKIYSGDKMAVVPKKVALIYNSTQSIIDKMHINGLHLKLNEIKNILENAKLMQNFRRHKEPTKFYRNFMQKIKREAPRQEHDNSGLVKPPLPLGVTQNNHQK